MTHDEVRAVLDRLYGGINSGDDAAIASVIGDDFTEHGDGIVGTAAFLNRIHHFRAAFPDLTVVIEDLIVDGDKFSSRTRITGTHQGPLMGMPATGRTIDITAVDLGHLEGGRAKERWGGIDTFALMQQLGAFGTPAAA